MSTYDSAFSIVIPISNTEPPITTVQDRQYLNMSIPEYKSFAEAVSSFCYIDRDGNHCKLKTTKTKKLKNLRNEIRKSDLLMKSLIWKEQLRLLEMELKRRQRLTRGDYS